MGISHSENTAKDIWLMKGTTDRPCTNRGINIRQRRSGLRNILKPPPAKATFPLVIRSYQAIHLFLVFLKLAKVSG
jgi:hypothetical protein